MRADGPRPIAMVMTSFAPGGTERQMIELIRRLDRRRWSVHVACFHTRGAWFDRVAEAARVVAFPVHSFRSLSLLFSQGRAFADWCRRTGISVVHTLDMPATIFALPAAAYASVPVRIANRREINPGRAPWKLAAQRAAYAFAHVIVGNSNAVARRLRREGVSAGRIAIIPNAVPSHAGVPGRLRSPTRVVTVANLRPEKGYDVLIDAAPEILRRCPGTTFVAVGGGPERQHLLQRVAERQVGAAFTFMDHCANVAEHLETAGVFVLPSRSEAQPNALLEAMAAGLPVVASAVGGVPEVVAHGSNGLLVRPGDTRMLADAVCRLLQSPDLAARLGAAARRSAGEWSSFDQMAEQFESLYLSELARRECA